MIAGDMRAPRTDVADPPIAAHEARLPIELKTAAAPQGDPGRLSAMQPGSSLDLLRADLLDRNPAFDPGALRHIAIVGAAPEGRRLAALCPQHGIAIAAMADDDPSKIGTRVCDYLVVATSELAKLDRSTPIVIASHRVLGAVERLVSLYLRQHDGGVIETVLYALSASAGSLAGTARRQ